jgi:hypothetical protein
MNKNALIRWGLAGVVLCGAGAASISIALAATASSSSTKQSYLNGLQQQYASAAANPIATKPPAAFVPTFAACLPISLPTPGIDSSSIQVGPDSYDAFVTTNQWTGPVGTSTTEAYVVWAGMTGDDSITPGMPAVAIDTRTISADGCSTETSEVGVFTDPSAAGPLAITSVTGGLIYLSTSSGADTTLSLVTHQYAATPIG